MPVTKQSEPSRSASGSGSASVAAHLSQLHQLNERSSEVSFSIYRAITKLEAYNKAPSTHYDAAAITKHATAVHKALCEASMLVDQLAWTIPAPPLDTVVMVDTTKSLTAES